MAEQRITDLGAIDAVQTADVIHVVDTSDTTSTVDGTSKRATISQVKTALSIPSTTSDIAEGTNLYYTEARVAANSAVQANTAKRSYPTGDETKLGTIETGATADQTAGEIKTAYESNADTNAYTDAEKTKLGTVETNADVTDTANVTAAGALMDSEVTNLAQVKAFDSADFATAAQGAKADTATQPADIADFETTTELNARDTANRDRANHTGTQAASTITGLATVATTGDYNDLSNLPDLSVYDNFEPFTNEADFPATGSADVIYLETSSGTLFRWTGSAYATISAQLALGETSSTAYRGDRGKIAYDHTFLTNNPHGVTKEQVGLGNVPNTDFTAAVNANTAHAASTANPHSVTKAQVGLGNADNTSDANKPVSTATQDALDDKAPLASPTLTGTTTVDRLDYDQAAGTVVAGGSLGATETIDWAAGTHFSGTLDSNITFTYSNSVTGQSITLYLSYDGTAQRTITWPATTWLDGTDGSAPTAPSAAGEVLVVTVQNIGGTYYGSATGNYAV